MRIGQWLTLIAILVALFGERMWRYFDTKKKKTEVRLIIKQSLELLKFNLLRIRDERNSGKNNDTDKIIFDRTSFSEVNGYYFLFLNLLLPNMEQLELSKYPATIEFFNHYKINIETIRSRSENNDGIAALRLATVNRLISRLENAIGEFNKTLEMNMCVKKVKKTIAKEGLIILGIIGIGFIIMTTPQLYIKARPIRIEQATNQEAPVDLLTEKRITYLDTGERKIYRLSEVSKAGDRQDRVRNIGFFILLLGYPVYLLARFIVWAVRTLREKNE
jgi:hypothetical protein